MVLLPSAEKQIGQSATNQFVFKVTVELFVSAVAAVGCY